MDNIKGEQVYAVITNDLQFAAANKSEERRKQVRIFLPKQIDFLTKVRRLKIPVIHLQLVNSNDDPRGQGKPDEHKFTRGSKGVQILEEVSMSSDLIIEKPKDSGFFETKLDETLKKMGTTTIIITGMQTQICVQTTAADAYFRGYKVLVPSDCVVSTRPEDTKRSLEWMADYCAKVLPSNEIINLIKQNKKIYANV